MALHDWSLYPQAEAFLQDKLAELLRNNKAAANLAASIEKGTSTRIFDWIDHMVIPAEDVDKDKLAEIGFLESREVSTNCEVIYRVTGSILFPILLGSKKSSEISLRVEDLDKFRRKLAPAKNVEGEVNIPLRKLVLNEENNCMLSAVERNGSSSFEVKNASDVEFYAEARQILEFRQRTFGSDEEGLSRTHDLIKSLTSNLDEQRLADAFFSAERNYWQSRNSAAKVQKARQDEMGLGWANTDHHTFRSSRPNFKSLISLFELMGLSPRERFHAGAQAGWGAQILEDAVGRVVVFADVDLDAEERETDFAHQGLSHREKLGTVGLWVSLHGESILQAGMHHLAARFSFENVTEGLKQKGVAMMNPFSNFPFLKQAFTQGENWKPERQRGLALESKRLLTHEQIVRFMDSGALGSHLENIQRGQGFKGFNQQSVSAIIKWTDPRLQKEIYA